MKSALMTLQITIIGENTAANLTDIFFPEMNVVNMAIVIRVDDFTAISAPHCSKV